MKLFKVLSMLHKREISRFQDFLESRYFNKRDDVLQLFLCWKTECRPYPAEHFWQLLYPKKAFSSVTWNLLSSRLFKLLEDFLSTDEMRNNEVSRKFHLAKVYRKLKTEKLFKDAIRDTEKALERQAFRNTDYLQHKHDLAFEKYDYIISIDRKEKTNLQEVSDLSDIYFLSIKLKQACNALSRENIKEEAYKIGLLDIVIDLIKKRPAYLETPAIAIYYYCYQILIDETNVDFFQKLKQVINEYQQLFPAAEMRDVYTVAINYAIKKLNTGSQQFIQEAFELYLASLKQGFLLEDGILLESTYSNIISLASKLGKHEWAKVFISEYQKDLKPTFRVPLFHYSLGKLYYEQGQLEESLKEVIRVETKASFLFLGARILQLKIYYESDEYDLLENLLESLRIYLQRSKDLGYRKEHYSNILAFTKQLLQLSAMNKNEKVALKNRIKNTAIFAEKDWFLKQLET